MKSDKETQFIEKAKNIHGDKYDYSLVEYYNRYTPVRIFCYEHGIFEQKPTYHILRKSGCPKCYRDSQKYNEDHFLQLANEKFGNQFTYGTYNGFQASFQVKCTKHDVTFETTPQYHLINKGGCPECFMQDRIKPSEQWISLFNETHNFKYDYSQAFYIRDGKKMTVICPDHGPFYPLPHNHILGHGCPECAKFDYVGGYCEDFFHKHPDKINELGTLYMLHIWDENESFYKVGITCRNIATRFKSVLPYNYDVVHEESMTLYEAHLKEQELLSSLTHYTPNKNFPGWTECVETLETNCSKP